MGLAIDLGATRTTSHLKRIISDLGSAKISSEQEAMKEDWAVVGEDILSAMNTFTEENEQVKK